MKKPILIASANIDKSSYIPVSKILEDHGYPVVIYNADKVMSGEDTIVVEIDDKGKLQVHYNGTAIGPNDISAAWYRKVSCFALPYYEPQTAKQLYVNSEVRGIHWAIWSLYPEDIWLSSPDALVRAERKLGQLLIARRVGFSIPHTLVSSDWKEIGDRLLPNDTSQMIIKMTRGITCEEDKYKTTYTHIANRSKMKTLQQAAYAFPALYQSYIPKAREWRVTVVGDEVFPAAIYTNRHAKDDWRRLQTTNAVRFKTANLPKDISKMCIEYLRQANLRYGAFDLVEQPTGEIVFLECNSAGQYAWLEEELGLPVSRSIASLLIKIARER